jgi:hypothetical protein
VDIPKRLRKEIEELETKHRAPEDQHQREKLLEDIRKAAEQENERFYRNLAIERRTAYVERVGYEGHTAEGLSDENFLYPEDKPPFEIAPDGRVYCTWGGKPVESCHQTAAEVFYWQELEWGGSGLVHDEEAEAFYTQEGDLAVSRERFDLRYLLNR